MLTPFTCSTVVPSHQGLLAHGKPHAENPARRTGRGSGGVGLLAVLLAATRPDQGVALAIRIIEQVGEDGRGEARIIELEGEIVPALLRLLRPGGPDLGRTFESPRRDGIADAMALGKAVLFLRYGFSLFAWSAGSLAQDLLGQPRLLPEDAVRRGPTASPWLIWPEDGCASIA